MMAYENPDNIHVSIVTVVENLDFANHYHHDLNGEIQLLHPI